MIINHLPLCTMYNCLPFIKYTRCGNVAYDVSELDASASQANGWRVTILFHYLDRKLCNLFDIFEYFYRRNVRPLSLTHTVVLIRVVVTVWLPITVPQERNASTWQALELIKLTLPLFWKQKCMTWSLGFVQPLCKRSAVVVAALN